MFLMKLRWYYWRWMLYRAKTFRYELQQTIIREKRRAEDAIDHAEIMEARAKAELTIAEARASA